MEEFVFTFLLCFVVLSVTYSNTTRNSTMRGFAIGSCVTVAGNATKSIFGACLNPAMALGIAVAHRASEGSLFGALYYSLVEVLAGVAAAHVFITTHAVDVQEESLGDAWRG